MALPYYVHILSFVFLEPIACFCNIFAIPNAGSEPVISFLNKGKSFFEGLPFCIFVRNKIYVMEIEMLGLVVLARYLTFEGITFYMINRTD